MTWTHALLSQNGDLVGVARDVEESDFGTFGTAYFIGLETPEEIYTVLDRFDLLNLEKAAPWFREWVHSEVRAAELALP